MKENRLAKEKSPYLRQHGSNPVDWYPWGDEALERAKREGKPIFLSIGYSSCYWCHVMEKDSFENEAVAAALDSSFISIKVDREERPDLDAIYMDAVVAMTGHGGWPMSVFLTPERKPFWGGTFFPREQFLKILERIRDIWENRRASAVENGEQLFSFLRERQIPPPAPADPAAGVFDRAIEYFRRSFDPEWGGFGAAPKFPPTSALPFLLRMYRRTDDEELLRIAARTLDAIARGGIHDHLGGGFHRYSTDAEWTVPHFEKMLYDNALLGLAFLEAYQLTDNRMFSVVAHDTLTYLLREMISPEGGFYTAQDAGDAGEEGEFYAWTAEQLHSLLDEEQFAVLRKVFEITPGGNFEEGKIILRQPLHTDWHLKEDPRIEDARHLLFLARARRTHPRRDEKILTGWNGLTISALCKGYEVLGEERFLKAALRAAAFICSHLRRDGRLLRRYCDGDAAIPANLEDYAYFVKALLDLFQASLEDRWMSAAADIQQTQDELFLDRENGGYFSTTRDDASLIVRRKDFFDGALPNPNGISFHSLLRLSHLTAEPRFSEIAQRGFQSAEQATRAAPAACTTILSARSFGESRVLEITVVGPEQDPERKKAVRYLRHMFHPDCVFAIRDPAQGESPLGIFHGKTAPAARSTFSVCVEQTCRAPVSTAAELTETILRVRKEKKTG